MLVSRDSITFLKDDWTEFRSVLPPTTRAFYDRPSNGLRINLSLIDALNFCVGYAAGQTVDELTCIGLHSSQWLLDDKWLDGEGIAWRGDLQLSLEINEFILGAERGKVKAFKSTVGSPEGARRN